MINLILLFLSLSSFSCFGALYKKRFEEIIPFVVIGIMLFLYVFYIFNILNIGFYFLILIIIVNYLLFCYRIFKSTSSEKKEIFKYIFTPGFIVFLFGFIILYILTFNNKVLLWDELRLWGAYPKLLFYDEILQLGDSSSLLPQMRSYNPGMPLFMYFILKIFGEFKENLLFFGYSLVGYSILIPITKNLKWSDWLKIPFYLIGLLLLPLMFANSNNDWLVYYSTLYIEPSLGIIFGYSLFLTFNNIFNDKFKYLLLLVLVSGMVLFKDTGILFSLAVGLSFVLGELFNYKSYKKDKHGFIKLLSIIIVPLIIFGSWKGIQFFYKSDNMYTSALDKSEVVSLFSNPTEEQKTLLEAAKREVIYNPIVKSNFSSLDRFYTFPFLFVCLIVFLVVYGFICGRKELKKCFIPIICFGISSIIYFLGTLFVYFFSIHMVASFPRYISLLFTAGSVLIVLLVCDKYNSIGVRSKYKHLFNYYIYILVIFSLFVLPLRQPTIESKDYLTDVDVVSEKYSNDISNIVEADQEILLIFTENMKDNFDYVLYHHQIYLDLLDEGFGWLNHTFIDDSFNLDDYKDYDYIYFVVTDDVDYEIFESVVGSDINDSCLYKLINSNVSVNLTKVV